MSFFCFFTPREDDQRSYRRNLKPHCYLKCPTNHLRYEFQSVSWSHFLYEILTHSSAHIMVLINLHFIIYCLRFCFFCRQTSRPIIQTSSYLSPHLIPPLFYDFFFLNVVCVLSAVQKAVTVPPSPVRTANTNVKPIMSPTKKINQRTDTPYLSSPFSFSLHIEALVYER